MNNMNNPIEELRKMKSPVSEQEWTSILHDKRYVQKFGRKSGLSPKGRAFIIAGVAAALITIPILVKTFSQKPTTAEKSLPKATESSVYQTVNSEQSQTKEISEPLSKPSTTMTDAPARTEVATGAAVQEHVAVTSATIARTPASNSQASTENPIVSTPTVTPKPNVVSSPAEVKSAPSVTQKLPAVASQKTVPEDFTDDYEIKAEPETDVVEKEQFFIPSAFTPNGDGLNDLFYVKANFEPHNFEITIINRSGDLLFHSRDINIGWDGQLHGNTLPQGMYIYIIKYKDKEGNDQKQQGQILLIP